MSLEAAMLPYGSNSGYLLEGSGHYIGKKEYVGEVKLVKLIKQKVESLHYTFEELTGIGSHKEFNKNVYYGVSRDMPDEIAGSFAPGKNRHFLTLNLNYFRGLYDQAKKLVKDKATSLVNVMLEETIAHELMHGKYGLTEKTTRIATYALYSRMYQLSFGKQKKDYKILMKIAEASLLQWFNNPYEYDSVYGELSKLKDRMNDKTLSIKELNEVKKLYHSMKKAIGDLTKEANDNKRSKKKKNKKKTKQSEKKKSKKSKNIASKKK
jgi:hypothetical protein